mmetsp:Transcript_2104/g.5493  ORF Transcript_2104/g.5493 Transcript_2104/m.5493 type:complete len:344 (+) Transcript_2104:1003-2034(+)
MGVVRHAFGKCVVLRRRRRLRCCLRRRLPLCTCRLLRLPLWHRLCLRRQRQRLHAVLPFLLPFRLSLLCRWRLPLGLGLRLLPVGLRRRRSVAPLARLLLRLARLAVSLALLTNLLLERADLLGRFLGLLPLRLRSHGLRCDRGLQLRLRLGAVVLAIVERAVGRRQLRLLPLWIGHRSGNGLRCSNGGSVGWRLIKLRRRLLPLRSWLEAHTIMPLLLLAVIISLRQLPVGLRLSRLLRRGGRGVDRRGVALAQLVQIEHLTGVGVDCLAAARVRRAVDAAVALRRAPQVGPVGAVEADAAVPLGALAQVGVAVGRDRVAVPVAPLVRGGALADARPELLPC